LHIHGTPRRWGLAGTVWVPPAARRRDGWSVLDHHFPYSDNRSAPGHALRVPVDPGVDARYPAAPAKRDTAERPTDVAARRQAWVEVRGLEPLASSVRVSGGAPLCGPAFPQVASDRQGQSEAFSCPAAQPQPGHQLPRPGQSGAAWAVPPGLGEVQELRLPDPQRRQLRQLDLQL
jgi:hypothetical protein